MEPLEKPILVHAHVFYVELWATLKAAIKNIHPHPFKLFVTLVEEHEELIRDIREEFPNVHLEIIDNRGGMMWGRSCIS